MYDVVIIGAGMAGLTAAIYAVRAKKSVLVLEKTVHGGQIINTFHIANWPGDYEVSGVDLMNKVYNQAVTLGAKIEYGDVSEITRRSEGGFTIKTDDETYTAGSVILAVGATSRKLGLENEERLTGHGVSYCATCDGAFYKDKKVAVIGGGNTALYDALYLANIAKEVYLVHRRSEFRGDKILVDKLREKDNVKFVLEYQPKAILGDEKVTGLELTPSRTLDVDGIFVAIGEKPMTENFAGLVNINEGGYIVAGEDCATSCPGVFVAGDCRTKDVRQLITAASDGAVSATMAIKYLDK